ncbi:unnamed protein product [Adineta ricciae]|uniref:G-protein coupled receptors family 3 profile domain-containing protein n=1 Tax=Adineta ricciae TaxID=249248 RepID=A0A814EIV8_ADIRI|nr:unnamed protein product [Adineta ricciae]CAF0971725.1 unnamed protein product [Adineta ricciae]
MEDMSPMNSPDYLHYSSDSNDNNLANSSLSIPLLALNDTWILPIFVLCLFGILCTIIVSLIFIYLSYRRLNGHFLLTNLFICFGVCFIYTVLIIFLLRANELFCGLREFLSQLAYALLYSALLCRYIMQWLGARILSKRTKQLTSLLIYFLLIFTQVPIGILWWYFTIPRMCQQRRMNVLSSSATIPELNFYFQQPFTSSSSIKPCSNRCLVDYRFYATFTYTIIQLFLCTIISTCLFLCRHCHRDRPQNDTPSINGNNPVLTFSNMLAFVLIDLIWLTWTAVYYFTHPFFVFPAIIIGMFLIASICLLLILLPQVYYYSKLKFNDVEKLKSKVTVPSTTLYSNKLASTHDMNDQEGLLEDSTKESKKKNHKLSNASDGSDELGASGTFLPITRTPKGQFKVTTTDTSTPIEKLDKLIYGEHQQTSTSPNNANKSALNERKVNASATDTAEQRLQPPVTVPLQRQLTSSSIASDFVTPVVTITPQQQLAYQPHGSDSYRTHNPNLQTSSSMYYSGYPPPRRDETIVPILCASDRPRTSTPVQMRFVVNSAPSSVPTTRRIYSGTDIRYIRHPYHHTYPSPPPPPTTPLYYSPQPQQYLFIDPYRTMPSRIGSNPWHSVLLQPRSASHRQTPSTPSSSYRRFHMDNRSLSQRLWDIDSGDDENDGEEDIIKIAGRETPPKEQVTDMHHDHFETEDKILLHIDDDGDDDEDEHDESYRKQYAQV